MNKLSPEQTDLINHHAFAQILSANENTTNNRNTRNINDEFTTLSYCPLQLTHNNQLLGHLSQQNPLISAVKNNSRVKAIFTGPQGYISPRWHNEQIVPTWNYATVSLICQLTFIEVNSKFKLSQNRSMECRRAFEKNLRLVDNNSLADIQI
jgi:predicted FMN-binding regulatory protein PaiB